MLYQNGVKVVNDSKGFIFNVKRFVLMSFSVMVCFMVQFNVSVSDMINFELPKLSLPTFMIQCFTTQKIETQEFSNVSQQYLSILGKKESSNNYSVIGGYNNHYLGAYQFGYVALKDIGMLNTKAEYKSFKKRFKKHGVKVWSITEQNNACLKLANNNKRYLGKSFMNKYVGKKINGIVITESGILSAAHNQGYGAVRTYLNGGKNTVDGFGTKISSYFKIMENV